MLAIWETWFLYLMIYSCIGWVYESTLCSITGRKLVNRGFLNGPVCPIYGVGAVAVIGILSPLKEQPALLFLTSAVLTTTLEYFTSWLMEVLFHARWWDYSNNFLNIRGRVCLLGFVAFGAMSVLVIDCVHPWVAGLVARIPEKGMHILSASLLAILVVDLAFTLRAVLPLQSRLHALKLALDAKRADIHWPGGFQLRRLMDAFPRLTFPRYHEQWKALLRHHGKLPLPRRGKKAPKEGE